MNKRIVFSFLNKVKQDEKKTSEKRKLILKLNVGFKVCSKETTICHFFSCIREHCEINGKQLLCGSEVKTVSYNKRIFLLFLDFLFPILSIHLKDINNIFSKNFFNVRK